MKINHNGIDIEYSEDKNLWCFVLRGRDRSSESLAKAKEAIDKPVVERPKFEPVEAWISKYNEGYKKVKITGIAEGCGYNNDVYVWIMSGKSRSKERLTDLASFDYKNNPIITKIGEIKAEIDRLYEQKRNMANKLIAPKITVPE